MSNNYPVVVCGLRKKRDGAVDSAMIRETDQSTGKTQARATADGEHTAVPEAVDGMGQIILVPQPCWGCT